MRESTTVDELRGDKIDLQDKIQVMISEFMSKHQIYLPPEIIVGGPKVIPNGCFSGYEIIIKFSF